MLHAKNKNKNSTCSGVGEEKIVHLTVKSSKHVFPESLLTVALE